MTMQHERLLTAVLLRQQAAVFASAFLAPNVLPLLPPQVAEHIALNSPARVLRDCERDLKVLERHRGVLVDLPSEGKRVCSTCRVQPDCDDIRDLAAEYGVALDDGPSETA